MKDDGSSGADREKLVDRLLGPLTTHFAAADQAYADYLSDGRTFLHASRLRRTNESARQLLLGQADLLPDDARPHALALIRHYDVWLSLWDDHAARAKPHANDEFVFQNRVRFPTDAKDALIYLYEASRD